MKAYLEYFDEKTKKSTKELVNKLVTKFKDSHGLDFGSKPFKIKNNNALSSDDFQRLIKKSTDVKSIEVIPPATGINQSPYGSSKFPMYVVNFGKDDVAKVVLAGGETEKRGLSFELSLEERLNSADPDSEIKRLFRMMNIKQKDIISVKNVGAAKTRRSEFFSLAGADHDIGSQIADIIISTQKQSYFISAKAWNYQFIYNGKQIPWIVPIHDEENKILKVKYVEKLYDPSMTNAKIFELFDIDSSRIASGINSYLTNKGKPSEIEECVLKDKQTVVNMLASSYGFGYWYVRQVAKNSNHLDIINFDSKKVVNDFVGKIKSATIKYPGTTSKYTFVKIETHSQLTNKNNTFVVHIRRGIDSNVVPLLIYIAKEK